MMQDIMSSSVYTPFNFLSSSLAIENGGTEAIMAGYNPMSEWWSHEQAAMQAHQFQLQQTSSSNFIDQPYYYHQKSDGEDYPATTYSNPYQNSMYQPSHTTSRTSYPSQTYDAAVASSQATSCSMFPLHHQHQNDYSGSGTPFEESPLSSPEPADGFVYQENSNYSSPSYKRSSHGSCSPLFHHPMMNSFSISPPPPPTYESTHSVLGRSSPTVSAPTLLTDNPLDIQQESKPKKPKLPQRKGGIQLWQFLYGLLESTQYTGLIEWTINKNEREFRMLEPESIATWWGTLKRKPTMTYDKFSRSLRYYYDKGILKKIPGERFVYRFLVDPEDMYRHIGNTERKPDLKSMPRDAKMAMSMFQKQDSFDKATRISPIVTAAPEQLQPSEEPVNMDTNMLGTMKRSNSAGAITSNSSLVIYPVKRTPSLNFPICQGGDVSSSSSLPTKLGNHLPRLPFYYHH
jgi:hypothetical protein